MMRLFRRTPAPLTDVERFEAALNEYEAENDGLDEARTQLDDLAACRQLLAEIRDLIATNFPAGVERPPSSPLPSGLAEMAAADKRVAQRLSAFRAQQIKYPI